MGLKKTKTWFPFHVGDYLADTSRFTALQHGIYLLLLLEYWREDGELSSDIDDLCEITKIDRRTYNRLMPSVLKKFEIEGNLLKHPGLELELVKHRELQLKRQMGGKRSAMQRWGHNADA